LRGRPCREQAFLLPLLIPEKMATGFIGTGAGIMARRRPLTNIRDRKSVSGKSMRAKKDGKKSDGTKKRRTRPVKGRQ